MATIDLRAIGSGYFRVLVDGTEVSKHLQEREAAQEAETHKRAAPDSVVEYVHDYRVVAELVGDAPLPDPEPTPDPTPDPEPVPDPDPEPVPPPAGGDLTPATLQVTMGPLVAVSTAPSDAAVPNFDNRFAAAEPQRFQEFLAVEGSTSGAYLSANHYGGLRSRLQWSIRNGQPIGPGVTDEATSAYARGRRVVRRYVLWSASIPVSGGGPYGPPPHNNTGMDDIEALYTLEGDQDALTHIHVAATGATDDTFNYLKMQNGNSDARIPSVALQALSAAHRLGIPYAKSPARPGAVFDVSLGSWKAAGNRQIGWFDAAVKPDGSIPSTAHTLADGRVPEAYLFNAMVAVQCLRWWAFIDPAPVALDIATRIVDHLIAQQGAAPTLPYLSTDTGTAPDLAGFYVWPGLALWQETGDAKYRTWALANLAATSGAFISGVKQFNQTYSTGAMCAEALLAGVPWH